MRVSSETATSWLEEVRGRLERLAVITVWERRPRAA
jgi:hypothetical protein